MTSGLAAGLTLPCGATLRNRVAKAAMTEGLADDDHRATPELARLYEVWAHGGAGLLVTGNVMIDSRHIERVGNIVVEDREAIASLRSWATAGTAGDTHLWMQLNHPGRQAGRWIDDDPVSASEVRLDVAGLFRRPRALAASEVDDLVSRFAFAAGVACEAGFTGVQIHAAHGYLISQFLSPLTNRRTDRWGGDLAGRARLLREVVRAARAAVGRRIPVSVKLNAADFMKGGFSEADCCQVVAWLEADGVDLLEISGGTYEQPMMSGLAGRRETVDDPRPASTAAREAYFLHYAGRVRGATSVPLMVTGGFRSRDAMERALGSGALDAIGLARPFAVMPDAAAQLLEGGVDRLPERERDLRLGPSRWLGPHSPFFRVRGTLAWGQLCWFDEQIAHIAHGRTPSRTTGVLAPMARHHAAETRRAWRLRKAARPGGA